MSNLSSHNLLSLETYDYLLPEELIAQSPLEPRDSSRLLVIDRKSGQIQHSVFSHLTNYLSTNDLLIANNSKVRRARLLGRRIQRTQGGPKLGGKIEFFLIEEKSSLVWEGLFRGSATAKPGLEFEVEGLNGKKIRGKILKGSIDSETGTVVAEFEQDPIALGVGYVPLPPYIKRSQVVGREKEDEEKNYQTVYAKVEGSSAAPTAGLHFTDRVFSSLNEKGIQWSEVTLHVGLGTFRGVKSENINHHKMHEESFELSQETSHLVNQCKSNGRRLVAVGTTSMRVLESLPEGEVAPCSSRTSLFIYPEAHRFKRVNALLTNFHLPKSTLFILVCAFGGVDLMKQAYEEAIRNRYRFFSYGDAMLIL